MTTFDQVWEQHKKSNTWGRNMAETFFNAGRELQTPEAVIMFRDGNRWCCVGADFKNLQESPCGFGESMESAYLSYLNSGGRVQHEALILEGLKGLPSRSEENIRLMHQLDAEMPLNHAVEKIPVDKLDATLLLIRRTKV